MLVDIPYIVKVYTMAVFSCQLALQLTAWPKRLQSYSKGKKLDLLCKKYYNFHPAAWSCSSLDKKSKGLGYSLRTWTSSHGGERRTVHPCVTSTKVSSSQPTMCCALVGGDNGVHCKYWHEGCRLLSLWYMLDIWKERNWQIFQSQKIAGSFWRYPIWPRMMLKTS